MHKKSVRTGLKPTFSSQIIQVLRSYYRREIECPEYSRLDRSAHIQIRLGKARFRCRGLTRSCFQGKLLAEVLSCQTTSQSSNTLYYLQTFFLALANQPDLYSPTFVNSWQNRGSGKPVPASVYFLYFSAKLNRNR